MKIWIICSKAFYGQIEPIKTELEKAGHEIVLPNSYGHPTAEIEAHALGEEEHQSFKKRMFGLSADIAKDVDAALCLNFEKHGVKNYIGGATFLELYEAFMSGKKIYLYNDIPEGILYDEIHGFAPKIIHGDLRVIVEK